MLIGSYTFCRLPLLCAWLVLLLLLDWRTVPDSQGNDACVKTADDDAEVGHQLAVEGLPETADAAAVVAHFKAYGEVLAFESAQGPGGATVSFKERGAAQKVSLFAKLLSYTLFVLM